MPGIVMFERRWGIASDDFVLPGILLFIFHIGWILAYTYLIRHLMDFEWNEEMCTNLLFYYTAIYLALSATNALVELVIAGLSVRGGIQDVHKRKGIIHFLYLRLGLLIVEFFCLIAGTLWKIFYYAKCAISEVSGKIFLGTLIGGYFLCFFLVICIWCSYDSAGRSWLKMKRFEESSKGAGSRFFLRRPWTYNRTWRKKKTLRQYQDTWDQRCRFLFCCMKKSDKRRATFAELAKLFATFFADHDIVPSDMVAGLMLLRKYQMIERRYIMKQRLNNVNKYLSGLPISPQTNFVPLQKKMTYNYFKDCIHYMHYALGAYGWPMYAANHKCVCCFGICKKLRCQCCSNIPCRDPPPQEAAIVIEDNCCECNYTVLKETLALTTEAEIVYANYHVEVGETPFYVAVDYVKKRIVICIRGTLSLEGYMFQDVMTDFSVESIPIPVVPPVPEWVAHKGMVDVAVYIREKLYYGNILEKARNFNIERGTQNYRVVVVGHSLGAGAAAILSMLIRQDCPGLTCFSYSPPGGTMSLAAAEYTRSFVSTVIVGKDFIPRIGLRQLEILRGDLMHAIDRSKDPKCKIFACSSSCCTDGGLPTSAVELEESDIAQFRYQRDKVKARMDCPPKSLTSFVKYVPMYPPGRIMHLVRQHPMNAPFRLSVRAVKRVMKKRPPVYEAIWTSNTAYDEVLISPAMIEDHMPDKVLEALQQAKKFFDDHENPNNPLVRKIPIGYPVYFLRPKRGPPEFYVREFEYYFYEPVEEPEEEYNYEEETEETRAKKAEEQRLKEEEEAKRARTYIPPELQDRLRMHVGPTTSATYFTKVAETRL